MITITINNAEVPIIGTGTTSITHHPGTVAEAKHTLAAYLRAGLRLAADQTASGGVVWWRGAVSATEITVFAPRGVPLAEADEILEAVRAEEAPR